MIFFNCYRVGRGAFSAIQRSGLYSSSRIFLKFAGLRAIGAIIGSILGWSLAGGALNVEGVVDGVVGGVVGGVADGGVSLAVDLIFENFLNMYHSSSAIN